ncbi:mechanosensitive ion channel family protein [Planctobacterium marinum]|uniref:Small conductance mechanosensitive ion channel protein YbdG n=1 Tax=Planctobacterium marinum TaxID=1631968 RepID=A0AA48KQP1_9ALTE|nr:small conductance mechanosensitive ion channel protein YbdG [Planctobacterium marinum]
MNETHLGELMAQWLETYQVVLAPTDLLFSAAMLAIMVVLAWLSLRLTKLLFNPSLTGLLFNNKPHWNNTLHQYKFFKRLAHVAPAICLHVSAPYFLHEEFIGLVLVTKLSSIYLIVVIVRAIFSVFNSIQAIYDNSRYANRVPINGFIQVAKLILSVATILLIVSQLLDKSPTLLLSGLGALTAIIILLFRDTILGFVSGINIVANRTVANGDWIEMPAYNADGTVLAVGLTTVKVRNWDKTISTIPTYALMNESLKNWRGMQESGGRRIKRAIHIDIDSVTFCDDELQEKLMQIPLVRDDLLKLQEQLNTHTSERVPVKSLYVEKMTNIGIFRKYVESYLKHHPRISQDMTLIVRQLPPGPTGLPLEIYCFTNDTNWVNYEGIQSDIFDHCIAILPEFNLKPFQLQSAVV